MTNRTSHDECLHPSTPKARARCRKDRAQYKIDHHWEIEYNRLYKLTEERYGGKGGMTTAMHALCGGVENADDSLEDLKIERHSEAWYQLAVSGFWTIMNDTAGGDLRWQINILDAATPEEIDNAPDTYPEFY